MMPHETAKYPHYDTVHEAVNRLQLDVLDDMQNVYKYTAPISGIVYALVALGWTLEEASQAAEDRQAREERRNAEKTVPDHEKPF